MDQAEAPLPAGPERGGDVVVSRYQSDETETFHVASTQTVGEAMTGWDTDSASGLWVPPSPLDVSRDLPPLQLQEQALTSD